MTASLINAAAVNPKGTKTLLANDISILFINRSEFSLMDLES